MDRSSCDSMFFGQLGSRHTGGIPGADARHLFGTQNGIGLPLTPGLPPFGVPVSNVIGVSAKEQVERVTAKRVVSCGAIMADQQVARVSVKGHDVGGNMRPYILSADVDGPIFVLLASSPKPATVRIVRDGEVPKKANTPGGILGGHDNLQCCGAAPLAVLAARGHLCASSIAGVRACLI